jgi:transaldolase
MSQLQALSDAGVSVWLDDLGRHRITSGELQRLVEQVGIRGVTTNPSIFANAVKSGNDYQGDLAASTSDAETTLHDLVVADVRDACRILAPAFDATRAVDGRVSIEVDPRLAFDTQATTAEAARLWHDVDQPNLMVKIPGTEAGLPAITESLAAGISINITLIFGIERYRQVQQAWLSGLERAKVNGHDLSRIASVASFFVSRLDTSVDTALDAKLEAGEISADRHAELRGRAAIANARNAYRVFCQARAEPRWQALEGAGAIPQRPLWASTSTKDPTFPATRYVDDLVAADTVNTMPAQTLEAVLADEASSKTRAAAIDLSDAAAAADAKLFQSLAAVGIDYDEVVGDLELAGVRSFSEAWEGLLTLVGAAQQKAG